MKAIAYMIILGGMLLMVSPLVSATCVQGDAAGTWHSYSKNVLWQIFFTLFHCFIVVPPFKQKKPHMPRFLSFGISASLPLFPDHISTIPFAAALKF